MPENVKPPAVLVVKYCIIYYLLLTKNKKIDNILYMRDIYDINDLYTLKEYDTILDEISQRMKKRRKEKKLTQQQLSEKSGVSFGSIKRFEIMGEISLKSLVKIAIALDCEKDFDVLFSKKKYASIQEVIDEQN